MDPSAGLTRAWGFGGQQGLRGGGAGGGLLPGSFSTGHLSKGALALAPADGTLWLVNNAAGGVLEQYSKTGTRLGTGLAVGYTLGGEFDLGKTIVPEPSTLGMLGAAVAGLMARGRQRVVRRCTARQARRPAPHE